MMEILTKPGWQKDDHMFVIKNWHQQCNCQKVEEVVVSSADNQDLKKDLAKEKTTCMSCKSLFTMQYTIMKKLKLTIE